jgi:hypothetical protein
MESCRFVTLSSVTDRDGATAPLTLSSSSGGAPPSLAGAKKSLGGTGPPLHVSDGDRSAWTHIRNFQNMNSRIRRRCLM